MVPGLNTYCVPVPAPLLTSYIIGKASKLSEPPIAGLYNNKNSNSYIYELFRSLNEMIMYANSLKSAENILAM